MFLFNPWTLGTVVKVAQVVIGGVVAAMEIVELFRDDDDG